VRRLLLLAAASAAFFGVHASASLAAGWCGTGASPIDRPDVTTGRQVHAIWAVPSDGGDTFATGAPLMADDIASVTSWWQGQDPTRIPRFDEAVFGTSECVDISSVRLPQPASTFAGDPAAAFDEMVRELANMGFDNSFKKYLIYYDGPVIDSRVCGVGGGSFDHGPAFAIVLRADCPSVHTDSVAAHELLHALGALPEGAPHACPGDSGHPCDSPQDVLYPFNSGAPLSAQVLDVNHDDYYGHSGSWIDIQDSLWLHRLDLPQEPLALTLAGTGSVVSDVPGVDCTLTCTTQWDQGSTLTLMPAPKPGSRFVRWQGACSGIAYCALDVTAPVAVRALFGPVTIPLRVSTAGEGRVACTPTCGKTFKAGRALTLRAVPAKKWRFVRWSGGCTGTRPTCRPATDFALSVRATFRKR
jgi:hypothetical protein